MTSPSPLGGPRQTSCPARETWARLRDGAGASLARRMRHPQPRLAAGGPERGGPRCRRPPGVIEPWSPCRAPGPRRSHPRRRPASGRAGPHERARAHSAGTGSRHGEGRLRRTAGRRRRRVAGRRGRCAPGIRGVTPAGPGLGPAVAASVWALLASPPAATAPGRQPRPWPLRATTQEMGQEDFDPSRPRLQVRADRFDSGIRLHNLPRDMRPESSIGPVRGPRGSVDRVRTEDEARCRPKAMGEGAAGGSCAWTGRPALLAVRGAAGSAAVRADGSAPVRAVGSARSGVGDRLPVRSRPDRSPGRRP